MKKQSLILSSIVLIFFISTSFSNSFDFGETMVVSGKASIIDGDTIRINKKKIRLYGIDAPELKQTCGWLSRGRGEESKWILEQILKNEIITCFYKQKDKYGRIIGICYVGELDHIPILMLSPQFEINGVMVNMGLAIAYKRYSNRYIKLEDDAKKNKRGVWKGKFEKPEEWRKKNK
jgi:endonuclease YncB( thermonuclease family)